MHPKWGKIPVWVSNKCPYVSKSWGKKLMEQIENSMNPLYNTVMRLETGRPLAVSVDELREWFPEAPDE